MSTPQNNAQARVRVRNPVPREGEGGFSQSWYPICQSTEVKTGQVIGRNFLDGRVAVFRTGGGEAAVVSAFCPHLGADLSLGTVVGDRLRCAYHHFEFDAHGACRRTGSGDPVSGRAALFRFPTVERDGLIWAFNGEEARWPLPAFPVPYETLIVSRFPPFTLPCDPWTVISNTADFQHFRFVHGFEIDFDATMDCYQWHENGLTADLRGTLPPAYGGFPVHYRIEHYATNLTYVKGRIGDLDAYLQIAFGIPYPGQTEVYTMIGAAGAFGDEGAEQRAQEVIKRFTFTFGLMGVEDNPLLETAHMMPGALTATDRQLARFFDYVRQFPRVHPSREYIS